MKKYLLTITLFLTILTAIAQTTGGDGKPAFNPTIKMKALVHSRFEASLTDSVDLQGKVVAVPIPTNFRLRRVELRSDIKLNDHWSGVIRIQLPELKSATPTMGRVIELAYFEYKHSDQFSLRGGQFKEPFELDELTSHEDLRMVDRGPTSRLFVSNNYSSYNPGLMVLEPFSKDDTIELLCRCFQWRRPVSELRFQLWKGICRQGGVYANFRLTAGLERAGERGSAGHIGKCCRR